MKRVIYAKWLFIILPLFYLVLSFIYLGGVKQFYISHYDPAYAYLMNGTNIASGHFRIGNIEHPGIPVDCFVAIIIFVKHLFGSSGLLYQDVLMYPESYLYTCSIVLALLLSGVAYFSGILVYRHSENILLALLFQLSSLFYSSIISMTLTLSAESSITIFGMFFAAYLYSNTDKVTTNKNAIVFGLLTAILFTTKIYCAPIILLVLFMVKEWKQRIIYLASSGIFSLLLLFPLYNQFRSWAGGIKSMVFHTGAYGQGNSGIINASLYKSNSIELLTTHYLFTMVFLLVLLAFLSSAWDIFKKTDFSSNLFFKITGMFIFFTIFILIIIKQYKVDCPNPLTHRVVTLTKFYYFIPLITFFPIAIVVSSKILSPLISFQFFHVHKQKLIGITLALFIIFGAKQAYSACYGVRNNNVSFEKTRSFIDSQKDTPLILIADGGDQVCVEPALFLGITFSGKWDMPQYFDFLKKIYPNTYIYELGWKDALTFWGDETNISTILQKRGEALVYISGADSLSEVVTLNRICTVKADQNRAIFKRVYRSENNYESIYLVKADTLR